MTDTDRIGIFVDGPNLYGGARNLTGRGNLDIPKLVQWIAQGKPVAEMSFWTGQLIQSVNPTAYAGQQRFFADVVTRIPNARIGRGSLKPRGNGRYVEKGVDVGVALDLALGAVGDLWDVGIVVSGDGDLARLGSILRQVGKTFEVVCCGGTLSGLLAKEADQVTTLDAAAIRGFWY